MRGGGDVAGVFDKKAPKRKMLVFTNSRSDAEKLIAALQSRPSLRGAVSNALFFPARKEQWEEGSIDVHCRSLRESRLSADLNEEAVERILAELEQRKTIQRQ